MKYDLIETNHGQEAVITSGTLAEVIQHINDNPSVWDWILDEDPDGYRVPEISIDANAEEVNRLLDYDISWCRLEVKKSESATLK